MVNYSLSHKDSISSLLPIRETIKSEGTYYWALSIIALQISLIRRTILEAD